MIVTDGGERSSLFTAVKKSFTVVAEGDRCRASVGAISERRFDSYLSISFDVNKDRHKTQTNLGRAEGAATMARGDACPNAGA